MTGLGNNIQTLNAGQYYDTTVNYSGPVFISASSPISVGRFLRTATCNLYYVTNPASLGDPAEAVVAPDEEMFSRLLRFLCKPYSCDFDSAYVQIVTRTADVNSVFLDNINIGAYFAALCAQPALFVCINTCFNRVSYPHFNRPGISFFYLRPRQH